MAFKQVGTASFALLATLLATSASADVPPPIPLYSYYGPLRICEPDYSVDVGRNEGVVHSSTYGFNLGRHMLLINRGSGFTEDYMKDLVRFSGRIVLPDAGPLDRVELLSRNGEAPRFYYLYDIGNGYFKKLQITSGGFDGTDNDLPILRRIRFGAQAKAACVDVPGELQKMHDRKNDDAFFLSPVRHQGPLTVCVSHLALDVAKGEVALLPWRADDNRVRVVSADYAMDVQGDFRSIANPTGVVAASGALIDSPEFEIKQVDGNEIGASLPLLVRNVPNPRYWRLLRRADARPFGPATGPGIAFGFSGEVEDTDRRKLIARLRARKPDDRCAEFQG